MTSLEISLGDFFAPIITGAILLFTWVLKQFGEQHLSSIRELASELKEMRKDLNILAERVKIVEVTQAHYHPEHQ